MDACARHGLEYYCRDLNRWPRSSTGMGEVPAARRAALTLVVTSDSLKLSWVEKEGSKVFETYWTTIRSVEAMDNSYRLLDLTVYGRQERWEDSPAGWPQQPKGKDTMRADGRPLAQWPRLKAGYSDDQGTSTP